MNVELTPAVLLAMVVLVDNRLTEFVKRLLINNTKWADDFQGVAVMLASFLTGLLAVALLPGINSFLNVAASPLGAAIIQAVVIAGLANGVDFIGGKVSDVVDSVTKPTDTTPTDAPAG